MDILFHPENEENFLELLNSGNCPFEVDVSENLLDNCYTVWDDYGEDAYQFLCDNYDFPALCGWKEMDDMSLTYIGFHLPGLLYDSYTVGVNLNHGPLNFHFPWENAPEYFFLGQDNFSPFAGNHFVNYVYTGTMCTLLYDCFEGYYEKYEPTGEIKNIINFAEKMRQISLREVSFNETIEGIRSLNKESTNKDFLEVITLFCKQKENLNQSFTYALNHFSNMEYWGAIWSFAQVMSRKRP